MPAAVVPVKCNVCGFEFNTAQLLAYNSEVSYCSVSCRQSECNGFAYQVVHPVFELGDDGVVKLASASKPDGVGVLLFKRDLMAIERALRRRTPDVEDAFITEYLSHKYDVIRTAVGDLAVGEPGSPAAVWRTDIEKDGRTTEGSLLEFAEKASLLAEAAATQHLKLLSRAYWDNAGNPDAEDPADWPAEAVYPPARAVLEAMSIIGWLLRPDVEGIERVNRICEMMLWTSPKYESIIVDAGVAVGKNPNGATCVDRGGGPKALNWRTIVIDTYDKDMYKVHQSWSKLSHNVPLILSSINRFNRVEGTLQRLTHSIDEAEHLNVAGAVAFAVGIAEARKSRYFGRPDFELRQACQSVLDQCRVASAEATAAAAQRRPGSSEQSRSRDTDSTGGDANDV